VIAFAVPLAVMLLATPPPPPPTLNSPAPSALATPASDATAAPDATPTPIALPSGFGLPAGAKSPGRPSGTPPPPKSSRNGIEGVWEVEIQVPNQNNPLYTHFQIKQQQNALSGLYIDGNGKRFPLSGTLDGDSVRLIVTRADGTTLLLEGKLDGTTDMLGMLTDADQRVPFTAAYRPKENFFENISPAPGGMGGMGGGASSGGGGIPPR
jgi:hypothetical protein